MRDAGRCKIVVRDYIEDSEGTYDMVGMCLLGGSWEHKCEMLRG